MMVLATKELWDAKISIAGSIHVVVCVCVCSFLDGQLLG